MNKPKIGFVSLGCPKNQIDTEVMLKELSDAGYEITAEDISADIIVINTCAFIESAKKEAIDNILDIAWLKKHRKLKGIICCGCLAERYREQVFTELPEVDAVVGTGSIHNIVQAVEEVWKGRKYISCEKNECLRLGGERVITTPDYTAYIKIAEGCDNHMGDVEVAKEMCRQAKLAGADCIKFQHHLPDEEMLSDAVIAGKNNIPLYEFLKQHALTLKQHRELMEYCKKIGIQYLCTPFSLKAAYELDAMGVDAFKIGSGEMTDIPTLVRIARLGKPMIVSTGMSTIEEIQRTYDVLNQTGVSLAFTNCISEYPPKYEDINLKFILQMEKHFPDAIIGHSDHTPDLYTSFGAVTLGARIIEKHVILDKRTPGPDQSVSIDFQELHQLVDGIRKLEDALGSVKKVHPGEEETRSWAFRSLVTKRPIKKGQRIEEDMIWSKRPGTGIPAYRMKEIIGKYAAADIDENVLLKEDDFC